MNEILKNLVVIGVDGDERLTAMRELLDTQGDTYAFIDAHSPAGITLSADWAARPLPQAFYNGRLEFYTLPTCRKFLKKHGAQLAEEAPQIPEGYGMGFFNDPAVVRDAMMRGVIPAEAIVPNEQVNMARQLLDAQRAQREAAPLRFVMDELVDHGADEVPFIENEEDEDDF